jgi:hypothetical protein
MAIPEFNFVQWVATLTPILLFMWNNRRKAKEDSAAKHEENQRVQRDIATSLRFHPPHSHSEKHGPLQAEGISFPPKDDD